MPDSSKTSLITQDSADSPASTKPASVENQLSAHCLRRPSKIRPA
jgi:hypothetical protein